VGKTRLATETARAAEALGCAVEWVRATRSAASFPMGAFASVLSPGAPGGAELLALVRQALVERAAGRRLVLCVDDAQLLDHGSAALVHQLVSTGEAFAVVTIRSDESMPDAVRALWKDDLCAHVELGPLARAEADALLERVLGGPLDGRSASALWELTHGNVLYLRELVLLGRDRGLLAEEGGIWRWSGELTAGTRLAELVEARLGRLAEDERAVLELVAAGAPLELGVLDSGEQDALERLERQEAVESRLDGRRRVVDVAHPLHGEVIRAQLARTRQEAIARRLADVVERHGARRRADVPRLGGWRLESGTGDRALFQRAAELALAGRDPAAAERFARAAVREGGGFEARFALGRALAGGRPGEAEAELTALEAVAPGDAERAAVAIAIARNRLFGLGRTEEALAALRAAEDAVTDEGARDELRGLRIRLVAGSGRPLEALALARPLLEDPGVREQAKLNAAVAAGEALAVSGSGDEALAISDRWLPVARRHVEELPVVELVLSSLPSLALRLLGRPVEAVTASEAIYRRGLAWASTQPVAVEAGMLGWAWLARGRVRTALRWFRESAALLRDYDVVGMLPFALAGIAQAASQAGDAELAREAIEEMDATRLGYPSWAPDTVMGRAWAAAAGGELTRARAHADEAAALAGSRGQRAFELRALHDLCRLGDPAAVAPRLEVLDVDGPLAPLAARHAAALVTRDGPALLEVGEGFAGLDMLLVAAEAADAAAAAFRDEGREASARTATARAALWLQSCEGARPPTLLGDPGSAELTRREREIALLAAGGLSSREIAERLVVSVRTVDNHLQRAYRKLGVAGREELAQVL
jgi:DNA-binding CsgD family transcriptional regulator